jgi:pilus assembly protein CpaD
MSSIRTSCLALALSAAALAGCATNASVAALPRLSTNQFPPVITTQTTGIQLAPHKRGLSDAQIEALRGLVTDWRNAGDGMIVVEIPACACDDAAEAGYATRDVLRALGVPDASIRLLGYEAEPNGPVRVSYQRVSAKIYDCSASWDDLTATGKNMPYQNFGCATASNLSAMIDRPRDLTGPRPSDPANGEHRQVIIERYRSGSGAADTAATGTTSSTSSSASSN